MNKQQIIIGAVAATLVCSANVSFAKKEKAENNPDFYGKLFLTNEHRIKNQKPKSDTDLDSKSDGSYLNSYASRVGVKGKYKTDVKGLDVIYQIELQVDIDNDDDLFKARNQFVGLKHKQAGSLIAGNYDTAFKLSQNKVDLFNDYHLGDLKYTFFGEDRLANTIMYSSPSIQGVQVRLATHSNKDNMDASSLSLSYKYNKNLEVSIAANTGIDDTDSARLVAQYKHKNFSVGLVHQDSKIEIQDTESAADTLPNGSYTATMLNGSYAVNKKLNLKLQLSITEQKKLQKEQNKEDLDAENASLVTAGVDYKLSKKSTAVAYYAAKTNHYPSDVSDKEKQESLLGIGLVHKF